MKKLIMAFLMSIPCSGWAGVLGFSLPEHLSYDAKGGYGFVNRQWLVGGGADVLYWQAPSLKTGAIDLSLPQIYLSVDHFYNANELLAAPGKAGGVFGLGLGATVGGFASKTAALYHVLTPDTAPQAHIPDWLMKGIDSWLSIQGGCGNRVFGGFSGVKPWECTVAGKLKTGLELKWLD